MSEQAFWDAIGSGDIVAAETLIRQQPALATACNPNCFGATPLTQTAGQRNLEMLKMLLQHGADPNQGSDWKPGPFTPLESIPFEDIEFHTDSDSRGPMADLLIEAGAEVHINAAAHLGLLERVRTLLAADPNGVTQRGGDGKQPLHWAANTDVAALLLEHGAPLDERCIDHESTPLDWAVQHRPQVGRYLMQRGAAHDAFLAAACDDLPRLQQTLPQEDSPNALLTRARLEGPLGNHALRIIGFTIGVDCNLLHAAMPHGGQAVVQTLLENGVDHAHAAGYDDATPLHLAAWHDNVAAGTALLDAGADIDCYSGEIHNNTPLGWAIVGGSAGMVELLLQRGAEVLDFFRDDAKAGAEGAFRCWSGQPLAQWARIVKLLG